MSELITLNFKSTSTYLDWNATSIGARYQYHADGTRFNGGVSYSVQKINQAIEGDSNYYRRFNQMQATIDQGSVSKEGGAGNEIYFIENKANNSAAVSYFKYGLDNKLNESQSFNYQSNILTSRTKIMPNSIGQITKSQKFNIHDKLVESNVFSYKKDRIGNDLIIIQKEKYSGNEVVSTTHKELYDSSGKIIKIDVYDKNDKQLERNEFSYFNNGNKCRTVKSTFNISGNLNHQEKIIYNKNGDLRAMVQSNYDNGQSLKDSKSTYYINGEVDRVVEVEYSADGKVIVGRIEKAYNITNAILIKETESSYSMDGKIIIGRINKEYSALDGRLEKITRSNRSDSGQLKREVESYLDINGQESKRISQYYSNGVTKCFERSFSAGKMTGKVYMEFDNNGNAINIKRLNPEGKMVDVPINASLDTFFKGVTQLADAINSFPTREQAPAAVDTIIGSHANLRNLVPVMNYASRQ
ncbi:hypothetical protein [Yersinia enterocolitica]|uniref:hypothetical protein n=1 Tax=Yersinia enterocolitica TaxID=630 RepID=UPI00065A87BE|nr:hypothetical protein [Yersinia enterocolitica]CRY40552.1 Uncharacterised protein [Yersinia enterocolitica]HDL7734845.1 hypothetical protein [Yersinia enterocolitica]HDL8434421.1 hypothetical protein [Yersinia enterocolitica]